MTFLLWFVGVYLRVFALFLEVVSIVLNPSTSDLASDLQPISLWMRDSKLPPSPEKVHEKVRQNRPVTRDDEHGLDEKRAMPISRYLWMWLCYSHVFPMLLLSCSYVFPMLFYAQICREVGSMAF